MSDFKALLVGINTYPGGNELRGCVNDVIITRDILRSRHAVAEQNIRTLVDNRATKKAIMERLEWLVADSHLTKNIIFHYSGHGAQVPNQDYSDNESDGMDEVLCPVDFDWYRKTWISDDEINAILSKKDKRCRLIMIADSCHSGTIYRSSNSTSDSIYDVRPKAISTPIDLLARSSEFNASAVAPVIGFGDRFWGFDDELNVQSDNKPMIRDKATKHITNAIIASGCADYQTSADAYFKNRYQGAFSYCLQKFMYNQPDITIREFEESVTRYLKSFGFSQDPKFTIGRETDSRKFIIV